jgi:hypothetical protein
MFGNRHTKPKSCEALSEVTYVYDGSALLGHASGTGDDSAEKQEEFRQAGRDNSGVKKDRKVCYKIQVCLSEA